MKAMNPVQLEWYLAIGLARRDAAKSGDNEEYYFFWNWTTALNGENYCKGF